MLKFVLTTPETGKFVLLATQDFLQNNFFFALNQRYCLHFFEPQIWNKKLHENMSLTKKSIQLVSNLTIDCSKLHKKICLKMSGTDADNEKDDRDCASELKNIFCDQKSQSKSCLMPDAGIRRDNRPRHKNRFRRSRRSKSLSDLKKASTPDTKKNFSVDRHSRPNAIQLDQLACEFKEIFFSQWSDELAQQKSSKTTPALLQLMLLERIQRIDQRYAELAEASLCNSHNLSKQIQVSAQRHRDTIDEIRSLNQMVAQLYEQILRVENKIGLASEQKN